LTLDRRTLLALFSLAFGLRILYAALLGSSPDMIAVHDTSDYRTAIKMAAGDNWLTTPISPSAPGYRALLAVAFKLVGTSWWTAVFLNALLGAATTLFLYRIGEQQLGRRVGLVSALWLALYVNQIYFANVVGRHVFVTFLFVWFVYSLVKPFHRMRNALWSAVLYVALTYTEPMFLLLLPLILVYLALWSTRHRALSIQYTFLFLTAVLLLNIPWTVRNYIVRRDIVLISLEARQYTEPFARLWRDSPPEPPLAPEATTMERPGFAYETVEFWRVVRLSDAPGDPRHGIAPEPAWSFRHNAISVVNFGLLLPLFVVGVVVACKRRHRAALVLTGAILSYAVLRGFYGAAERARLPVEPLIILVALYGAKVLLDARRAGGQPAAALAPEA
jgi:Dolichyl-phosphate-mannose-protein mannosyltransferase